MRVSPDPGPFDGARLEASRASPIDMPCMYALTKVKAVMDRISRQEIAQAQYGEGEFDAEAGLAACPLRGALHNPRVPAPGRTALIVKQIADQGGHGNCLQNEHVGV